MWIPVETFLKAYFGVGQQAAARAGRPASVRTRAAAGQILRPRAESGTTSRFPKLAVECGEYHFLPHRVAPDECRSQLNGVVATKPLFVSCHRDSRHESQALDRRE